nr:MAG TPA: hypothetical protein [Caudoviricetes sp.]
MTKIYINKGDRYFLTVNEATGERTRYYFDKYTREEVEESLKEEGENFEWCCENMTKIYINKGDRYYLTVDEDTGERTRYFFDKYTREEVEDSLKEEGKNFEWCD